jgi:hypothetical protein
MKKKKLKTSFLYQPSEVPEPVPDMIFNAYSGELKKINLVEPNEKTFAPRLKESAARIRLRLNGGRGIL